MIDFSLMKVGDSVVLPARDWEGENKAIYQKASDYAATCNKQFEMNFRPVSISGREHMEVSLKRIR